MFASPGAPIALAAIAAAAAAVALSLRYGPPEWPVWESATEGDLPAAAAPVAPLARPEPEPPPLASLEPLPRRDLTPPAEPRAEARAEPRAEPSSPAPVLPLRVPPREPLATEPGGLAEIEALVGALAGQLAVEPATAVPEAPPSFDVVRLAADGVVVVAGRAAAGDEVELLLDGLPIETVTADARGEWVAVPERRIGTDARELALVARRGGARIPSRQVVLLALQEPATTPLAVLVDRETASVRRLLQAPGGLTGGGGLELQAVDYPEDGPGAGSVRLVGRAAPGATVRIQIDAVTRIEVLADADGAWRAALDRLEPGDYALGVLQLDAGGGTVARIDTPFTRAATLPRGGPEGGPVDYVIVQPGNSLWRIARRLLGDGRHYADIHAANRDLIEDPDLIFPGQVFRIPSEPSEAPG
jgi:hypothetical protein